MSNPTPAQVQRLFSAPIDADVIADAIVDAGLMLGSCGDAYPDDRRSAIVKYLAAHVIATSDHGAASRVRSETVDGTSYTLAAATLGKGLEGTTFGQQALLLDTNGCLASDAVTSLGVWAV